MKKTEYCLKDAYLLHKWEKIQSNLKQVEWETDLTEKVYTDVDTLAAAACAGGACEIDF
jgi:ribonucleoside-diphosphate reductase alpha chain